MWSFFRFAIILGSCQRVRYSYLAVRINSVHFMIIRNNLYEHRSRRAAKKCLERRRDKYDNMDTDERRTDDQ